MIIFLVKDISRNSTWVIAFEASAKKISTQKHLIKSLFVLTSFENNR
jgi:hypothetical protein